MNQNQPNHGAYYDPLGNIVLTEGPAAFVQQDQTDEIQVKEAAHRASRNHPDIVEEDLQWTMVEESVVEAPRDEMTAHQAPLVERVASVTHTLVRSSLQESSEQLRATKTGAIQGFSSLIASVRSLPNRTRLALQKFWSFVTTPVVLPWKKHKKPKTRLQLFFIDTIRFGGTFATIFVVLFGAVNYQSFWQIARAQLALGEDIQTEQALGDLTRPTPLTPQTIAGAIVRGKADTSKFLSFLPPVGPSENRLIIPKLGKNVPIVRPSMNNLLKEDWKKFEEDVQEALKYGVVHYPGSAKPGLAGNFFLTGHSSYYPWAQSAYKDVFARLGELGVGDTYSVYYGGDLHTYKIVSKKEVRPSDTSVLDQPSNKRLSTLMTCTPVGTALRRLILIAEEINPVTGIALKVGQKMAEGQRLPKLEALPI